MVCLAQQGRGVCTQFSPDVLVFARASQEPAFPGRIFPIRGWIVGHVDQAAQLGEYPAAAPGYFGRRILREFPRLPYQVGEATLTGGSWPLQVKGIAV